MNLPVNVRARLVGEGLYMITNFDDFKDEELIAVFKNMFTLIPGLQ